MYVQVPFQMNRHPEFPCYQKIPAVHEGWGCGPSQGSAGSNSILGSDQGNYLILEDNNEKNMPIFALEPQFHCRKYGFKGWDTSDRI